VTATEAGAASVRRLVAELRADRDALGARTDEVRRFAEPPDEPRPERLGALALGLDRAYTALEAALERVTRALEGGVPSGERWHAELLRGAGLDIPQVRPPVLGEASIRCADRIRRFRHFLRHAYGVALDEGKVDANARTWLAGVDDLNEDLDRFEAFLLRLAAELEAG